ncbi:ribonuclease MRP protein subunit POP4 [Vicia villosa]|uniref:ribonuclease MRP protein subunit POP4 n=1 Tax=Vicia villosa TaxID=3911 RepID=UPI00273C637E|nr:ribonuclease MRP protein subunit POP4 [Vicia villosa]
MASDSRKRTLEALERRIQTEHILEENKNQKTKIQHIKSNYKKPKIEHVKSPILAPSTPNDSSSHSSRPSSDPPNKANFSLFGRAISQDKEDGPEYAQLSVTVDENLLTANQESSFEKGCSVSGILHELLKKGDAAQKYMQGSRSMKIDNWILLDNYVQGRALSSSSQTRALQIHSKRSKKHLSMKQHKKNGSFNLPQEFHKFDIFKPMHEMWKDYIMLLIKSTGKNQLAQCLLGADLHGAIILVVECKLTHFTGTGGIMIRETAEAFGIITENNKFRVVPKKGSVFRLQVDCWKVTLHGDKLDSRKVGL